MKAIMWRLLCLNHDNSFHAEFETVAKRFHPKQQKLLILRPIKRYSGAINPETYYE